MKSKKSSRIDLGIAIAHTVFAHHGDRIDHRTIAAFCDCTWSNIWLIEQRALHKLKRAAHLRKDRDLAEMFGQATVISHPERTAKANVTPR